MKFTFISLQKADAPSVIVAGSAAAVILANNNSDTQLYSEYNTGLIRLVQPIDFLAKKNSQFLWLLQDPVLKERLPAQLSSLDNKQINLCNKAAEKVTSTICLPNNNKGRDKYSIIAANRYYLTARLVYGKAASQSVWVFLNKVQMVIWLVHCHFGIKFKYY